MYNQIQREQIRVKFCMDLLAGMALVYPEISKEVVKILTVAVL